MAGALVSRGTLIKRVHLFKDALLVILFRLVLLVSGFHVRLIFQLVTIVIITLRVLLAQ
jgi:hypothetical protein